jgi:hypothetical protein
MGIRVKYGLSQESYAWSTWAVQQHFSFGLYTNIVAPSVSSVLADLVEASFLGYSRQPILGSLAPQWNAVTSTYTMQYRGVVFQGSDVANQSIHGYFIVDPTNNLLVSLNEFIDGPYPCGMPGVPLVLIVSEQILNQ